jgi:O-antigen ligase
VEPATRDLPARYQGLGQNPNTVPLLLAPCLALTVWLLMRARSRRERIVLAALAVLFDGSIIASGSRGSLIAGFAGVAIVVLLAPLRIRTRAVLTVATAAALAASIGIGLAPKSKGEAWRPPPPVVSTAPGSHPNPGYSNVEGVFPLDSDIGTLLVDSKPTRRTLFGLTGRGEAWRGAIDLGNKRPLVGYGFGTEGRVFVDRWTNFVGGLPENSYIGMYLQVGLVGVIALLGLIVALVFAAVRRPDRWEIAGPLGALAAGLILAFVQSYVYSVGNIATLALWSAGFLAAAQPMREQVQV